MTVFPAKAEDTISVPQIFFDLPQKISIEMFNADVKWETTSVDIAKQSSNYSMNAAKIILLRR